MDPIRNFRPFIMGSFLVSYLSDTDFNQYTGEEETVTITKTALVINIGGEWFPYSSIGIYGGFRFIELELDPTRFLGGVGHAFLGIEWFLD